MTILSLRNKLGKGLRLRFRKEVSIHFVQPVVFTADAVCWEVGRSICGS